MPESSGVLLQSTDAETRIQNVISVGAAYRPSRDTREILGSLFAIGMLAASVAAAIYATITDRWSPDTIALVALTAISAAFGVLVPWEQLRREWQMTMYWVSLLAITASVYTFDVSTLSVFLLMPMMALTCFFWDHRTLVATNLIGAAVIFTLPVGTGHANDASSALIITLPALIAVALLSGALAARFNTMRLNERTRYKATIEALSTALTARDGYTGSHSQETLWLVNAICDELRLTTNACEYVADVALLHDIGKIGIPNDILHEPGQLNDAQWEVMKQHPVIGERIVVTVPGLEEVARAIRHEHERWDGGGYPDSLKSGEIPLASRIVLVCDAFHAMTSDRPYRKAMNVDEARLELSRNAGTQFDPTVVGALLHVLDRREPAERDRRAFASSSNFNQQARMTAAAV
ncbi:MAG: HD-GYP domain-containing protein [Solirubrobacterales bacterium]